jgi:hypothetical protein
MSKTFCPLPWIHLATHPHGAITLCCEADQTKRISESYDFGYPVKRKMLHNTNYDFNDIHNSDSFSDVRLKMLNGEKPIQCNRCFQQEEVGMKSKRLISLRDFDYTIEHAREETSSTGKIEPQYQFVELRLGNHCNLACRSCNMYSSSRWMSEIERHSNSKIQIDKTVFNWPLDTRFWESLLLHKNSIKTIYINGGEPLLIDKHKKFLEDLVESGVSANIELVYSTNATIINRSYDNVWTQFKSVHFMVSIDDLRERNSYIRWPSDWNKVLGSLAWIKNLCETYDNMSYIIMQTVSVLNIYYVDEFERFFKQQGANIALNYVSDPVYYDCSILPESVKTIIIDKLSGLDCEDSIIRYLSINKDENNLIDFFKETEKLDAQRNENFKHTFPQFYEVLNDNTKNICNW